MYQTKGEWTADRPGEGTAQRMGLEGMREKRQKGKKERKRERKRAQVLPSKAAWTLLLRARFWLTEGAAAGLTEEEVAVKGPPDEEGGFVRLMERQTTTTGEPPSAGICALARGSGEHLRARGRWSGGRRLSDRRGVLVSGAPRSLDGALRGAESDRCADPWFSRTGFASSISVYIRMRMHILTR